MHRAACLTVLLLSLQGCALSRGDSGRLDGKGMDGRTASTLTNPVSPIALCVDPDGCAKRSPHVVHGTELGRDQRAPVVAGHPLTSVVVTQCNLVVAVYMTMPDGRFLRFDEKADVSADELVTIAYSAAHSERVEVSCEGTGVVAFEKHEPV